MLISNLVCNFFDANITLLQKTGCAAESLFGQDVAQRNSHLLFEQMQKVKVGQFELARQAADSARCTRFNYFQDLPHSLINLPGYGRISLDSFMVRSDGGLRQLWIPRFGQRDITGRCRCSRLAF